MCVFSALHLCSSPVSVRSEIPNHVKKDGAKGERSCHPSRWSSDICRPPPCLHLRLPRDTVSTSVTFCVILSTALLPRNQRVEVLYSTHTPFQHSPAAVTQQLGFKVKWPIELLNRKLCSKVSGRGTSHQNHESCRLQSTIQ